ncbi:MAG: hypothetical protein OXL34_00125 [Gemmatimonadota bacterium]|nr:hypothetical protein [Gemmatimonadota bacterium]
MSPRRRGTFAFRLDVDSLICLEQGIPNLLRLGERHGVRFTFFVNMGRSFSWRHTIANVLRRRQDGRRAGPASTPVPYKLSAARKLGRGGTLRTVVFNPRLGRRYRAALDLLHREGHELGLHGGSNHPAWQYRLDELGDDGLERLFRPAFEEFRDRYGHPRGFASPGFRYNQAVLGLLDNEGFEYASDMAGEVPFRPGRRDGASRHTHFQVPVNVIGERRVPVIEQGLARGQSDGRIVQDAVERIRARPFALMYGHPYVEGVHTRQLAAILSEVADDYDVVTVKEYLRRWKETTA